MEKSIEEYEAERADDRVRIRELEDENKRLRSLSEIVSLSRAWPDKPIGSVETERFINDFWELIDRYHLSYSTE